MFHNDNLAIALLFGVFFVLMVLRTPVAFSLAIAAAVTAMYVGRDAFVAFTTTVRQIEDSISPWGLLAIPFFILAGEIMSAGSISQRLIDLANACVGRFRGGLASVNILGSMFFGGVSGSSVADTSATGSVLIPAMVKRGYDAEYAVGVTVSASTQGIVIPPSHNAILFALAFGYPYIDRLFIAGILPGVLIGVGLLIVAYIIAIRRKYPREAPVTLRAFFVALFRAVPAVLTAVIIVGGILTGWFTAAESAVVAVVYALLLTLLLYRDLSLRQLAGVFMRATQTTGMVMFLIGAAGAFGWMMARLNVPELVTSTLINLTTSPIMMTLIILGIMIALGCIMDMAPLILLLAPILKPAVVDVIEMDPAHFGIVMLMALGVGLITPPVGTTLFVGCSIGKTTIERTSRVLLPFYFTLLGVLLLVTFLEPISMTLVHLLAGD